MVPTKYASSLLKLLIEKGYPTDAILQEAGINFDPSDQSSQGYVDEVSALDYSKLYQLILSLLQDESFGIRLGRGFTPGAFRMMCYAIIHSENLGKALRRASDFFRIFFNAQAELTLELEDDLAIVGYIEPGKAPDKTVQATDAYGLSMWHRFCGWLTGRTLELQRVQFQAGEPENNRRYEELFGCPVDFDGRQNVLIFDATCLSWSLVHTEQSLREFLRTAPYQLIVMPSKASDTGLIAQVRALIGHDFSQGFPSFEEITSALNMSAPTLRRRLKREGKTFQQLKDECRCDAAVAYLSRPDLSINAVAALMGFTDPSAFHRSFKKWTGMPPGEYRSRELFVDDQA
ncbi:AraC-like DNA-binding protein [Sinobacterium caligoides]|uniref:AraC-like DNA-binding protein n=2 Tax=Sinobacterium caligoides TaxID=933926 RepID=A0A3N2DZI4_9GAMM|nr:AraC-like DNA-binding protein [Sinobacterium caligoides]